MPTYLTQRKTADHAALSQPDGCTCQSASICEALGYPTIEIPNVRASLLAIGKAGDPSVMGEYLSGKLADKYIYKGDASLEEMAAYINPHGAFLIIHTSLTVSGHVIAIDGVDIDDLGVIQAFHVLDSWSEFDGASFSYPNSDTENSFMGWYSANLIYSACVADGGSFDAAKAQYLLNKPDASNHGAWLHVILP